MIKDYIKLFFIAFLLLVASAILLAYINYIFDGYQVSINDRFSIFFCYSIILTFVLLFDGISKRYLNHSKKAAEAPVVPESTPPVQESNTENMATPEGYKQQFAALEEFTQMKDRHGL